MEWPSINDQLSPPGSTKTPGAILATLGSIEDEFKKDTIPNSRCFLQLIRSAERYR